MVLQYVRRVTSLDRQPYTPDELMRLAESYVTKTWHGVDPQTHDELTSEFVTSAWLASLRLNGQSSGRSFVWRTGDGTCRNHYRRLARARDRSSGSEELTDVHAPTDDLESHELTERRLESMLTFIRLFKASDRELVTQAYGVGCERKSMTVIASERGVSVAAISKRLSMLRHRLRVLVEEDTR